MSEQAQGEQQQGQPEPKFVGILADTAPVRITAGPKHVRVAELGYAWADGEPWPLHRGCPPAPEPAVECDTPVEVRSDG